MVQELLGSREAENGTKIDKLLQAGASAWQDVETNSDSRRWQGSCQRGNKLENMKDKKEESQEKSIRGF